MMLALRWGVFAVLVCLAIQIDSNAIAESDGKFSCADGPVMEFQSEELPTTVAEDTSSSTIFTIGEADLVDGAWPRFDVTLTITLSRALSADDHGLVSVHANDKTFLLIRVSPKSTNPDQSV